MSRDQKARNDYRKACTDADATYHQAVADAKRAKQIAISNATLAYIGATSGAAKRLVAELEMQRTAVFAALDEGQKSAMREFNVHGCTAQYFADMRAAEDKFDADHDAVNERLKDAKRNLRKR